MDFGQEKFKNSNLPRGKRMTVLEQFFKTGIWPLGGVGVVQLFAYPTARVMTIKIKVFIENIYLFQTITNSSDYIPKFFRQFWLP